MRELEGLRAQAAADRAQAAEDRARAAEDRAGAARERARLETELQVPHLDEAHQRLSVRPRLRTPGFRSLPGSRETRADDAADVADVADKGRSRA